MSEKNEDQNVRTTVTVSPAGSMNAEDWKRLGFNLLRFFAPTLGIFFAQLALGVDYRLAMPVALYAFYQALSDFFSKLNSTKIYPAEGSDLAKKDQ